MYCPDVTLATARERRDAARKLLSNETDPSVVQWLWESTSEPDAAEENTFEAVVGEWYAKKLPTWASTTAQKVPRQLEKDIFVGSDNCPRKILLPLCLQRFAV